MSKIVAFKKSKYVSRIICKLLTGTYVAIRFLIKSNRLKL